MESTSPPSHFSLILPSNRIPTALSHLTRPLTDRFLVRYRNILVEGEEGIAWGLVKDSNYCGKAFVIEITEAEAHNIQLIKRPGEMFEVVGQNYILLKIEKEVQRPTNALREEQIHQLLQEIGGNNKVSINLLKNAFDTYEEYAALAEKAVAAVGVKERENEVGLAEKVQLKFNAKRLSGKALMEVPKIVKQTGNWSEEQNLELKLANN